MGHTYGLISVFFGSAGSNPAGVDPLFFILSLNVYIYIFKGR